MKHLAERGVGRVHAAYTTSQKQACAGTHSATRSQAVER